MDGPGFRAYPRPPLPFCGRAGKTLAVRCGAAVIVGCLAGCGGMPAVEWSDREDSDLSTLEALGPDAGAAYVDACDRFVRRYPDSVNASRVALSAAAVARTVRPEEAALRVIAVLRDPRMPLALCSEAAALLRTCHVSCGVGLFEALDRTRCSFAARAQMREPAISEPVVPNATLDRLGFLEGCFQSWTPTWGIRSCWRRDGAAWRGTADSYGEGEPMYRAMLTITAGATGVILDVEGADEWWVFRGLHRRVASEASGERLVFASPEGPFELRPSADGLVVSRDFVANDMGRVPPR